MSRVFQTVQKITVPLLTKVGRAASKLKTASKTQGRENCLDTILNPDQEEKRIDIKMLT